MSAFLTIDKFIDKHFDITTEEGALRRIELIEVLGEENETDQIFTVLSMAFNGEVCYRWLESYHSNWVNICKKYETMGNKFRREHCNMSYNDIEQWLEEIDSEVYYVGNDISNIQFKLPTNKDSLGFDKALRMALKIKEQNEIIENIDDDYDYNDIEYDKDEVIELDYDEM